MPAPKAIIEDGKKRCPKCDYWKPLGEFGKNSRGNYQSYCRGCRTTSKCGVPTSERQKKTHREYILKTTYGITGEDFNRMLSEQGGVCKVCGEGPSGRFKYLCVDHCHTPGRVRGLLCHNCNKALGMVKDDVIRLRALADYLEDYKWL